LYNLKKYIVVDNLFFFGQPQVQRVAQFESVEDNRKLAVVKPFNFFSPSLFAIIDRKKGITRLNCDSSYVIDNCRAPQRFYDVN